MKQKKVTKNAWEQLLKKIKLTEAKLKQAKLERGEHGADQDGWHGEAYQLAYLEEMRLAEELAVLNKLKRECVVSEKLSKEKVEIGAVVTLRIDNEDKVFMFDGMVYENQPMVITPESPIGKGIYRKKVGEVVLVKINSNQKVIHIIKVDTL